MEGLTWGAVSAVFALLVAVCSVASFLLGRRKAAADEAKEDGSLVTDLKYIKETIRDTTKSIEGLSMKLDAQNKQREEDYRHLLVQLTELKASYRALHTRVDNMERQLDSCHTH